MGALPVVGILLLLLAVVLRNGRRYPINFLICQDVEVEMTMRIRVCFGAVGVAAVILSLPTLLAPVFSPGPAPPARERGRPVVPPKGPLPLPSQEVDKSYFPSGWMSKSTNELSPAEANARLQNLLRLEPDCEANPHSLQTCYKITFTPAEEWMGLAWQYPDGNWGYWPGRNASGYNRITLWARSDGTEVHTVEFLAGGHTRAGLPWQASCQAVELWCDLGQEWRQYTIDLRGKDLTNLPVGFVLVIRRTENPNGCTIYLDDIRFEK